MERLKIGASFGSVVISQDNPEQASHVTSVGLSLFGFKMKRLSCDFLCVIKNQTKVKEKYAYFYGTSTETSPLYAGMSL